MFIKINFLHAEYLAKERSFANITIPNKTFIMKNNPAETLERLFSIYYIAESRFFLPYNNLKKPFNYGYFQNKSYMKFAVQKYFAAAVGT